MASSSESMLWIILVEGILEITAASPFLTRKDGSHIMKDILAIGLFF
jgi:hypothetical protein